MDWLSLLGECYYSPSLSDTEIQILLGSKIPPRDREVNLFGINIFPLGNLFIENGKKRR